MREAVAMSFDKTLRRLQAQEQQRNRARVQEITRYLADVDEQVQGQLQYLKTYTLH